MRLGLPAEYVEACDARTASQRAGVTLSRAALWFPGGGWVQPSALCRIWLAQAQPTLVPDQAIAGLRRVADRWALVDAAGRECGRFDLVILAVGASDSVALPASVAAALQWQRGQTTWFDSTAPGGAWPRVPVACGAYAITLPDRRVLIGATRQSGETHTALRAADHRDNLARAAALLERTIEVAPASLHGCAGVRVVARDRLPVVGALPILQTTFGAHVKFARHVPRESGLYVISALGSRGITWAARAGQTVAAWIAGAPLPLEESLVEAIDPARFAARELRRSMS
jgi:tRNA 5-methylaminomethyl-2-thiouridine biosynthesis bifunctional protein